MGSSTTFVSLLHLNTTTSPAPSTALLGVRPTHSCARIRIRPRGSPYAHSGSTGVSDIDKGEVHTTITKPTRKRKNRSAVQAAAER